MAWLSRQFKESSRVIYLWNGEEESGKSASISLTVATDIFASRFDLFLGGPLGTSRVGDFTAVAELLQILIRRYSAVCAWVYEATTYKLVYEDRPGVGWMLYLPTALDRTAVPEAAATLPVYDDDKRLGTIVASLADAIFDERNTDHVRLAHAIETRLVSTDLLPTYVQLLRTPET